MCFVVGAIAVRLGAMSYVVAAVIKCDNEAQHSRVMRIALPPPPPLAFHSAARVYSAANVVRKGAATPVASARTATDERGGTVTRHAP